MLSEQLLLPLVVIGLVVGTLVLSGLASRQQQHQAARRSIVQRMEGTIRRIEQALERLSNEPLDGDLRQTLRRDVLDRYRMIGAVFKHYPDLAARFEQAEMRLNAEAREHHQPPLTPADEIELQNLIHALDSLKDYLEVEGTLHSVDVQQRQQFVQYLGEYAAQLLANYYHAEFDRLASEDKLEEGRALLAQLMGILGNRGPDTDRVRELYDAAQAAIKGEGIASSMPHPARRAS